MNQLAEDLRTLAWLHAAERDCATWLALHSTGFPAGLVICDDVGRQPMQLALQALGEQVATHGQTETDAKLASDYADIYLTHALQASPYESVWRDEDHLMLQAPTFAVRAFYRRHGLQVADWRQMPDDHLSHELGFVAWLLEQGLTDEARRFLDEHLLTWLPDFAARVIQRASCEVHAGLAALTLDSCRQLRARLTASLESGAVLP